MIWLSWRQFRIQAVVAACVLAAFAVVLLISGLSLAHLYATSGLPGCRSHHDCPEKLMLFGAQVKGSIYQAIFYFAVLLAYAAPALIGIFWGATLIAREFETGTFRLAWTQSISRNRWLLVKVGLVGLAAMVVAGLMSLMVNWWIKPVFQAAQFAPSRGALSINRLSPLLFGVLGITPIGYAAFAFALGLTAGVLIRRTIPAMAVTLGGFAFVELAWLNLVRPHLLAPVRAIGPLNTSDISGLFIGNDNVMTILPGTDKPSAWILSDQSINAAGRPFSGPATHACLDGSMQACGASLAPLHIRQLLVYEPASRYWPLQSYETAIFLVVAIALALFCLTRISRRRFA